jgi:hypothetical protein
MAVNHDDHRAAFSPKGAATIGARITPVIV